MHYKFLLLIYLLVTTFLLVVLASNLPGNQGIEAHTSPVSETSPELSNPGLIPTVLHRGALHLGSHHLHLHDNPLLVISFLRSFLHEE
jgi:hypothetical protein